VILTDQSCLVAALRANIERNAATTTLAPVRALVLDWLRPEEGLAAIGEGASQSLDFVLGADCVYWEVRRRRGIGSGTFRSTDSSL
jgi:hypothetical protein